MVSFDLGQDTSGVVANSLVTAQTASNLTGYNNQHVRRLTYAGKLDAIRIGRP